MTDERDDAPETSTEPSGNADESPAEEATETVEIDGQQVEVSTLREWRDKGLMLQDYTKKTMAVAEQRRDVEAKEATLSQREQALEARLAAVENRNREDPYAQMDETIPGLGDVGRTLSSLQKELSEVKAAISEEREESRRLAEESDTEQSWSRMLSNFGPGTEYPFVDPNKIRRTVEERGWKPTPQSVGDAMMIEYGYKIGQADGESRARKAQNTRVPMGAGQLPGIQGARPQDVPRAPAKPLSQTSMEEIKARILADPRRPKASID